MGKIRRETYRHRLREVAKKPEETYRQMAARVLDLVKHWTKDCKTEELRELVATEQVLRSLGVGAQEKADDSSRSRTAGRGPPAS